MANLLEAKKARLAAEKEARKAEPPKAVDVNDSAERRERIEQLKTGMADSTNATMDMKTKADRDQAQREAAVETLKKKIESNRALAAANAAAEAAARAAAASAAANAPAAEVSTAVSSITGFISTSRTRGSPVNYDLGQNVALPWGTAGTFYSPFLKNNEWGSILVDGLDNVRCAALVNALPNSANNRYTLINPVLEKSSEVNLDNIAGLRNTSGCRSSSNSVYVLYKLKL